MGRQVMGYWDCPYCGSKEIKGTVIACPSCGRARGDVQFYMKNHAEGETREEGQTGDIEYLSEEEAKYAGKNPDWYCSFCNSLNRDNAQFCTTCGASRADSESNYFDRLKKKQADEAAEAAAQPLPAERAAPRSKRPLFFLLAIAVLIIGLVVYMSGNRTTGGLQISSIGWTRAITVEENRQFSESGWSLPQGAELTGQRNELHHYDSVLDHYEDVEVERSRQVVTGYETYYTYNDLGNGTFEQVEHERPIYDTEYYTETVSQPIYVQVPRYQTKYYYNIWRWVPSREATASGDTHEAAWPELNLSENEREGEHREAYRFTVVSKKDQSTATYRLAESAWRSLNVGDEISITAKRSGAEPYLSDSKGEKIADLIREK